MRRALSWETYEILQEFFTFLVSGNAENEVVAVTSLEPQLTTSRASEASSSAPSDAVASSPPLEGSMV